MKWLEIVAHNFSQLWSAMEQVWVSSSQNLEIWLFNNDPLGGTIQLLYFSFWLLLRSLLYWWTVIWQLKISSCNSGSIVLIDIVKIEDSDSNIQIYNKSTSLFFNLYAKMIQKMRFLEKCQILYWWENPNFIKCLLCE